MNNFKKIIAVLICAALLLPTLISCNTSSQNGPDSTEGSTTEFPEFRVEIQNGDELSLKRGQVLRLNVASSDPNLIFSSSDKSCVTVSLDGTVSAVGIGTATVTVKCGSASDTVRITVTDPRTVSLTADKYYTEVGAPVTLSVSTTPEFFGEIRYELEGDTDAFTLEGNVLTPVAAGTVTVTAYADTAASEPITVTSFKPELRDPQSIVLSVDRPSLYVGDVATLSFSVDPEDSSMGIIFTVTEGDNVISISGGRITAIGAGVAKIVGRIGNTVSNEISVTVEIYDPYSLLSKADFYKNYTVATSYTDACLRSEYGLMSGMLTVPDQAPTVSADRPMENGVLVKNSEFIYTESGNCYIVVDSQGNEALRVYRGGAYITLEEVAAYVYAFGDIPANHSTGKKATSTLLTKWGEYLRLNHSKFNGNVTKYPYQPILPNISGCGGTLQYMEMDIGTTGTDCDPSYSIKTYNDGSTVTRGAARIVYGKNDLNGNGIYERGELHLFYTYNHYNDFQEYLNYYGGWGNIFGNVTGGGKLSDKYDYNPTPYIEVVLAPLASSPGTAATAIFALCCYPDKRYAA